MRMTENKAEKILDFLTRRMGYEKWNLHESYNVHGSMNLEFLDKNDFGSDLLIEQHGELKNWCFYVDMSLKDIVKSMLSNIDKAYCFIDHDNPPLCQELIIASSPWIYVFKPNETLESLMIEMDLENE